MEIGNLTIVDIHGEKPILKPSMNSPQLGQGKTFNGLVSPGSTARWGNTGIFWTAKKGVETGWNPQKVLGVKTLKCPNLFDFEFVNCLEVEVVFYDNM